MADRAKRLVLDDLSFGRDGYDAPWALPARSCVDAVNVDWFRTKFANKRSGMVALSTTFSAGGPFTGTISSLFRHVPGTDEGAAELWAVDDAATNVVGRLAGATTWTAPTFTDPPTGNGWDWSAATIDGKLFLAYQSAVNRLHVWDPVLNVVRRTGLGGGGGTAPVAANQGAATAVAFDAASTLNYGAASPATLAHTCGANATILVVHTRSDAAVVSGVTYNGVALTQLSAIVAGGFYAVWYLVSPATGAHNIVVTAVGSQVGILGISYTGARVTGVPDAVTTNNSANATITTSITSVTDQSLACYAVEDRSGVAPTAGANCTQRATGSAASCMTFFDGNGPITPPGVFTMTANITAASTGSAMMFTLAPGTGSYSAVARSYRVRWTQQIGGITVRRSEPTAIVAFTPSGTGSAARITQPTPPGEGETHWEIEASDDGVTFYRIATVAIGTTTYDDTAAVSSYNTFPLSALTGTYAVQTSYKFIAADQNRLLGFANWTSTEKQARVVLSAVIGSLDVGDAERVDTSGVNSYIDLDEKDSGIPTGLCGPLLGSFFVFKDRQTWQLTATGATAQPYRQDAISKTIGSLAHVAVTRGEDKFGNASLYWMSHRGPYRWSVNGLEYIGRNLEDLVLGPSATMNLAATKRICVTCAYPDKRQVWFWWATGSSNDCNVGAIFDIQTGGWSRVPSDDRWANIRCAVLFANTVAAAMSRDLKPYVGQTGAANRIYKADTGTDDAGQAFQAYVDTVILEPGGAGFFGGVGDALLLAKAASGVTITATVTGNFGMTGLVATGTALLTAGGSETRVSRRLEGSALHGDVQFVQYRLGDAAQVSNAWTLERLVIEPVKHDPVSA